MSPEQMKKDYEIMMRNAEVIQEWKIKDFTRMLKECYERVRQLPIVGNGVLDELTQIYRYMRDLKKGIEAFRKDRTEQPRLEIAQINAKVKEVIEPIDQLESLTKVKIEAYNKALQEEKVLEDKKLADAAALFDAELPAVATVATSLSTSSAVVYEKTVKRFEVTNLFDVPAKYLIVDEKAVEKDIKLGIADIPGIRIWEEKVTQVRSR